MSFVESFRGFNDRGRGLVAAIEPEAESTVGRVGSQETLLLAATSQGSRESSRRPRRGSIVAWIGTTGARVATRIGTIGSS